MNNKLREKILKELRFLLKEDWRSQDINKALTDRDNCTDAGQFYAKNSTKSGIDIETQQLVQKAKAFILRCQRENTSLPIASQPVETYEITKGEEARKELAKTPASPTTTDISATPSSPAVTKDKPVRCPGNGVVVLQQWLKYAKNYKNIVVDGVYGKNTHAALAELNNEPRTLGQVRNEVCGNIAANIDTYVAQLEDKIPNQDNIGKAEVVRKRSISASPKQTAVIGTSQPQDKQDILKSLAIADNSWMKRTGESDKYLNAYNTNPEFKARVDAQAKSGGLDAAWIISSSGLQEAKSFYDRNKFKKAEMLYERLMQKI